MSGNPKIQPQSEDYLGDVNTVGIRACDNEGKRCAESLTFDFNRNYNLNTKIVRIFNTYGPYMHPNDGRVVSNFIMQALQKEPITIYGDGSQTRSFCYVDDMIEAMVRVMATPQEVSGPFNLGNDNEFSVSDLATLIQEEVGGDLKLINSQLPQDDPVRRRPDLSKIKSTIDWSPQTNLEQGIGKTIEYFKTYVS